MEQKTIAGKTRRHRVSNKRIREIHYINDVTEFANRQRKKWNEHVLPTDQ